MHENTMKILSSQSSFLKSRFLVYPSSAVNYVITFPSFWVLRTIDTSALLFFTCYSLKTNYDFVANTLILQRFERVKCNLVINNMPDVHKRIGAQAQTHFAYNGWFIFHSLLRVWKVKEIKYLFFNFFYSSKHKVHRT